MQKLRILYLKKALGIPRSSLWNIDHSISAMGNKLAGPLWVTLGEYDAIASYSAQYDSLFSYVSEHNSELSSQREIGVYSRAMYLLPYLTDLDSEKKFWSNDTVLYLGVIRLHLVYSPKAYNKQKLVAETIQNLLAANALEICMYQTIELGDIVLAVHSNSLETILNVTEELNSIPDVAKTYTYCGMNLELLKNSSSSTCCGSIPFVSMSFSIRETSGIRNALQVLSRSMGKSDKYAITGTDDCMITWSNVPEAKIVDTFSDWVKRKNDSDYKHYDLLNMHTTAGISTDLKSWTITPNGVKTPIVLCSKLSSSLDRFERRKPRWYRYFNRLLSSLMYMANASEFDEFVFLFYPSANAILENLININSNVSEDNRVYRYIQNWNYLMENIMQAEGHLTLMPEVHPQIFDIPPVFLEYIQAFLGQCVTLLHESSLKDDVEFLLTPKMCDRIEAHELFNIFEYKIGLVLIDIPFTMFKDLQKMQIALCHEVSHYVGEKYRRREYRKDRFIEAAAILVAKNLFGSFNKGLINTLIDCFSEALDKALAAKHQSIECFRLKEIVSIIGNWTYGLFTEQSAYAHFLKTVFSSEDYISGQKIKPVVDYLHTTTKIKHQIVPLLNDLYHLFRECFADLCAVYLLSLEADEYYGSIESQISILSDAKNERLAIRLAVVLAASKRDITNIKALKMKFYAAVSKHYEQCLIPPSNEPRDQVFPVASIINLYGYLSECYKALEDIDTTDIKKFLVDNSVDSVEDWDSFYCLIDDYRSALFD